MREAIRGHQKQSEGHQWASVVSARPHVLSWYVGHVGFIRVPYVHRAVHVRHSDGAWVPVMLLAARVPV